MRWLLKQIKALWKDENFLHNLEKVEGIVSKVLSLAMLIVLFTAVYDLCLFILTDFLVGNLGSLSTSLFKVFGLFLNVLIALEILENITAYLKKHVIQVELVIVTSLIAVARKIIILDLEQKTSEDLIALAVAIFSLSLSYWIIRQVNHKTGT